MDPLISALCYCHSIFDVWGTVGGLRGSHGCSFWVEELVWKTWQPLRLEYSSSMFYVGNVESERSNHTLNGAGNLIIEKEIFILESLTSLFEWSRNLQTGNLH